MILYFLKQIESPLPNNDLCKGKLKWPCGSRKEFQVINVFTLLLSSGCGPLFQQA